ncbi:excisionase family DNA binding protein [Roseimicrobium gellanilyticum]|uniref:Excisionase family DNA binding protein n=1 Tax=Roseimicrobium gellanilyticum TaxID=748857 RepID=A0A366H3S8_9BACT|nr:response regulator [Roseimicrobium gellanilyticum]RBP36642.1 excisionase family DNA binding protein [Roseimicrobium gellanilyticum]
MSQQDESSDFITVKEAAYYLRIPLPTAYYLVKTGRIPVIPIGGRYRIKRSLLDRDLLRKDADTDLTLPTVLVVDDEPAIQSLFKKFLRKAGLGRVVVGSGAEALALARQQQFALVFLDLQLPDIPGDVVYEKLKEQHPDLPIVVITGYPDSEVLSTICASGPVTVIQKPLNFDLLNQAVKQLGHKGAVKPKDP